MKRILNFFDKFEDHIRGNLSRYPILYTIIGSIAIVLFWRGVWHTADILQAKGGILGIIFYEPVNMIIVVLVLLATGLFVSYFIGDTILISGLKQQKKTTEKTEKEIKDEEGRLDEIRDSIKEIKSEVDEIIKVIEKVEKK
jgi:mannitol-specific phosphotransferase system IIBC component